MTQHILYGDITPGQIVQASTSNVLEPASLIKSGAGVMTLNSSSTSSLQVEGAIQILKATAGATFDILDSAYSTGISMESGKFLYVHNSINLYGTDNRTLTLTTSLTNQGASGILNWSGAYTLTVSNNANVSGTNTGDQDLSGYVPTSRTVNGKALSSNITLGLASSDFANQGTATTVLHGNAAGNPAFGSVVEADLGLTDLTTANVSTSAHGFVPKAVAPAGGTLNYFGINNGETTGSWKSASSAPGAAAAILASDVNGYCTAVKFNATQQISLTASNGIATTRENGTAIEQHIRPFAGHQGFLTFTEDAVADRWVIGIKNADSKLYFASGSAGSNTTRATLDSDGTFVVTGNVGIGTTAPSARLDLGIQAPGLDTVFSYFRGYGANVNWPVGIGGVYDAGYVDQYLILNGYLDGGTRASPTFFGGFAGGSYIKESNAGITIGRFSNGSGQSGTPHVQIDTSGNVSVLSTTDSSSTTTGALKSAGGLGIVKSVNIGGSITAASGHIGDASTNYSAFAADGTLTMVGTARVLKEVRTSVIATRNGSSAPTDANRAVGASGGVLLPVKQFSKTTQNDIYFELHPESDIDSSVNVAIHFMWLPGSGWTTGNYLWKLEYLVKNENGAAYNTGTPTTISADVTPANATDTIETVFASTVALTWNQTIWCHFYRDVAGDNADDTGDLRFVEMEYTANKLGE